MQKKLLRELDFYEKFFALPYPFGEDSFNQCIAVGFKGRIKLDILQESLKILQEKYPILKTSVEKTSDEKYFYIENSNTIQITSLVAEKISNEFLEEVLKDELHKPINMKLDLPLRVVLIQNDAKQEGVLIVTAHHLAFDGISLTHFIRKIFQICSKLKNGPYIHTSFPMTPAITSLYNYNPTNAKEEKKIFKANNHELPITESKIRTGLILKKIDSSTSLKMRSLAKEKKVKLQACFISALLLAMTQKVLKEKQEITSSRLVYQTPVNLRPYLSSNLDLDQLGCFISTLYFEKDTNLTMDFWETASEVNEELHGNLTKDLPLETMNSINSLVNDHNSFEKIKSRRKLNLPFIGVSNLGKVELSNHNYEITFMYPTVSLQGTFYEENNLYVAVSTINDEIFLSFLYPDPLLPRKAAECIADQLITQLENAAYAENLLSTMEHLCH